MGNLGRGRGNRPTQRLGASPAPGHSRRSDADQTLERDTSSPLPSGPDPPRATGGVRCRRESRDGGWRPSASTTPAESTKTEDSEEDVLRRRGPGHAKACEAGVSWCQFVRIDARVGLRRRPGPRASRPRGPRRRGTATRSRPPTDRATGLSVSGVFRAARANPPGLGENRRCPIFQGGRSARSALSIARPVRPPEGAHDGTQTTAAPLLSSVPGASIASPISVNLSTAQGADRAGPARRRTSRALTSVGSRASKGRGERR